MFYTLKVEWDDGDQSIVIGNGEDDNNKENNVITKAIVHIDTLDDNTNTKSEQLLARIKIEGKIPKDKTLAGFVENQLREIFKWSVDCVGDTTYRKVTLEVMEKGNVSKRKFVFENVFVRDYVEEYDSSAGDKDGTFKLDLTQRENELNTIEII